jgi:hypothetical protein
MIGDFKNGGGEFYDQELLNGRAIFVRWARFSPLQIHATLNNRS